MEEKKDWKEELQDIINREMFKEDLMIQIKSLVEQELDKAREEGFTQAERNHLLTLLEERKRDGSYYGNQEQYYKRTDRLISKLNK